MIQIISHLLGGAGEVDMRNVGVVASDHACDQMPRRKQEKKTGEKREKREVIFMSMTHNSLWP